MRHVWGLKEGQVSAPISESELRGEYPKSLLNSLRREAADPENPDVSTLVGATQVGVSQNIHLAMQPTRPSLADDMRILGWPKYQAGGWDIRREKGASVGLAESRGKRPLLHYEERRNCIR